MAQTRTSTAIQQTSPSMTVQGEKTVDGGLAPMAVSEPAPSKPPYFKISSAAFSFFVAGVNDGSLGSIIPYLMESYGINTNMVAILYGCTFAGWFVGALSNSSVTRCFDLGSILCIGAFLQVLAHVLRTWFPPLPLFAITFFFASLGQAYNDTHANTFVSSVPAAHRFLGLIHAMYMAGCLVGPLVATAVGSATSQSGWCLFYIFPLGIGVINMVLIVVAFRDRFAPYHLKKYRAEFSGTNGEEHTGKAAWKEIKMTVSTLGVWLLSLFFFFFLGASITAGGWMVEYLVDYRNGKINKVGYVLTGFYGGSFLGRLLLAEPTYRLGERRMVFIYALVCIALQLVFWLVPNIIAEAVAVSFLGFFSGPFFATGISVASRIFSAEIRSSAIAFVFVLGQIGGAMFPAITGVIAARAGVKVLQPMLVGLLSAASASWLILPKDQVIHRD